MAHLLSPNSPADLQQRFSFDSMKPITTRVVKAEAQINLPSVAATVSVDGSFDTIQEKFEAFNEANPSVYRALVQMALDQKRNGATRGSITQLYEVLRYSATITLGGDGDGFKLNNNFRSRYARLIMSQEAELEGFFKTRSKRTA